MRLSGVSILTRRIKLTEKRQKFREDALVKAQNSPNSYATKKARYEAMTDDFPRY